MSPVPSHKELLEKYPLDQLENWFAKIEKMDIVFQLLYISVKFMMK